jgi:hypothetical protein
MKGLAFRGENYDPVSCELIDPMVEWNPQRTDPNSPFLGLKGSQQCMGNSFQNAQRHFGRRFPELKSLAHNSTYSYYAAFEGYLKEKKLNGPNDVYLLENHANFWNQSMKAIGFSLHAVVQKASLKELRLYLKRTNQIAILGIAVKEFRHITTVLGTTEDGFVITDPYGLYPYRQRFGHCVVYSDSFLKNIVTRMVLFYS